MSLSYLDHCYTCRQRIYTRPVEGGHALVTHLDVGVKCPGSGRLVIEDMPECEAGCLCSRCDETRSENAPLFGEAQ